MIYGTHRYNFSNVYLFSHTLCIVGLHIFPVTIGVEMQAPFPLSSTVNHSAHHTGDDDGQNRMDERQQPWIIRDRPRTNWQHVLCNTYKMYYARALTSYFRTAALLFTHVACASRKCLAVFFVSLNLFRVTSSPVSMFCLDWWSLTFLYFCLLGFMVDFFFAMNATDNVCRWRACVNE